MRNIYYLSKTERRLEDIERSKVCFSESNLISYLIMYCEVEEEEEEKWDKKYFHLLSNIIIIINDIFFISLILLFERII